MLTGAARKVIVGTGGGVGSTGGAAGGAAATFFLHAVKHTAAIKIRT